jgi:hypothetical protein
MRRLVLALLAAVGLSVLGACTFNQTAPGCDPCAGGWPAPAYSGGCGGDPGIGRAGTGAFAR